MADYTREFEESPIEQGQDERVSYRLDTTPWGGGDTPTSAQVFLFDANQTDLSATKLSGSATIDEELIYTPLVIDLEPDVLYRLEVQFVVSGQTLEPYTYIMGKL